MNNYTIKQLELVSGIKAHTIRMWEKRYGLFAPERTDTNIRRYSDLNVQQILNIALLTHNGHRISKVAKKSSDEISALILKLSSQELSSEKNDLEPLILSILSFDQTNLKTQLNKKIKEQGLEKTFENLIIPLLYRIGILWQIGLINSTHEHFVSNIIKHTIILHTEILKEPKGESSLILFFLPEGEFHEIGLLFYAYIGKKMGYRTLYLGQSTPVKDVILTAKKIKPTILFTSISTLISNINLEEILEEIQNNTKSHLFVSGYKAIQEGSNIPKSIHVISTLDNFKDKITYLKIK